jgi:hypothetical protein
MTDGLTSFRANICKELHNKAVFYKEVADGKLLNFNVLSENDWDNILTQKSKYDRISFNLKRLADFWQKNELPKNYMEMIESAEKGLS